MPRGRRYIESGAVYEICFRAKASLPLVAHKFLNFIIKCVLARVQRDEKVILCHDIWNGSHPHIIVVTKDAEQATFFYGEVQKKITDIIKRLLGKNSLNIWDGKPSVIKLGDLEAVIDRIAYLYANPAQDNLETRMENFPGLSSWNEFQASLDKIDAKTSEECPWIRLRSVPELSSSNPSQSEGSKIIEQLCKANKELHLLVREPNRWMRCFGIQQDSDVERINSQIISQLRQREVLAEDRRIKRNKKVLGAKKLQNQPLLKPHTPKKNERKIFIFASVKEIRLEFIERFEKFTADCKDCLRRWRAGELSVTWPLGAFKPPLRPIASLLAT